MKHKIYKNLWAGHETYFIAMHPVRSSRNEPPKTGGYGLVKTDEGWQIEKNAVYYSRDLKDSKHFPVVGQADIEALLIEGILSCIDNDKVKNKIKEDLEK